MGVDSIAELIKGTKEEAQGLLDSFFSGFPKVKQWMDETEKFAKKNGYVEDWYGRRRRLPDMLLEPYEVKRNGKQEENTFNPFLYCTDRIIEDRILEKYKEECKKIKSYKDLEKLREQASKEGITIYSNTSLIAQATRKAVNARVQGGSATMTKVAMIKISNDPILTKYGFKMLIGVHDELIGECPEEYSEEVADRLSFVMRTCIEDYCEVPFKCDAEISSHWYLPSYLSALKKEYNSLLSSNTKQQATDIFIEAHSELLPDDLLRYIENGFEET